MPPSELWVDAVALRFAAVASRSFAVRCCSSAHVLSNSPSESSSDLLNVPLRSSEVVADSSPEPLLPLSRPFVSLLVSLAVPPVELPVELLVEPPMTMPPDGLPDELVDPPSLEGMVAQPARVTDETNENNAISLIFMLLLDGLSRRP